MFHRLFGPARLNITINARFGHPAQPEAMPIGEQDDRSVTMTVPANTPCCDEQAKIVREMFERYVAGESTRAIAADLNRRGVPSSGSTWKRKTRRCSGWAGSAVRAIIVNALFTGLVQWNTTRYVKNPDTGKLERRPQPRSEWSEFRDESLRIVFDELFSAAQPRGRRHRGSDPAKVAKSTAPGQARFVLSGLLKCTCGASCIMVNQHLYGCGGAREGACDAKALVRRDHAESVILDPIRHDLLAPERVERMALEMQRLYVKALRSEKARATEIPKELQALDAKVARLRERQRAGDPDMTADELQSVIDRVLEARRRLEDPRPAAKEGAKIAALLPNAADLYRKQIKLGLDGDPRQALKARALLNQLIGPVVVEQKDDGSVWARFDLRPRGAAVTGASRRGWWSG